MSRRRSSAAAPKPAEPIELVPYAPQRNTSTVLLPHGHRELFGWSDGNLPRASWCTSKVLTVRGPVLVRLDVDRYPGSFGCNLFLALETSDSLDGPWIDACEKQVRFSGGRVVMRGTSEGYVRLRHMWAVPGAPSQTAMLGSDSGKRWQFGATAEVLP